MWAIQLPKLYRVNNCFYRYVRKAITYVVGMKWFEKIRQRREELGLSQAALAKDVDISQAAINKIENGLVARSRFLPRIAKRLKIPLNELSTDFDYDIYADTKKSNPPGRVVDLHHRMYDGSFTDGLSGDTPVKYIKSDDNGDIWIWDEVILEVNKPPFLRIRKDVSAGLIEVPSLEPQFSEGDIVFFCKDVEPIEGATYIFLSRNYKTPRAVLCKIGYLYGFIDGKWAIKYWNIKKRDEDNEALSPDDWHRGYRIVAVYFGSWDEGPHLPDN